MRYAVEMRTQTSFSFFRLSVPSKNVFSVCAIRFVVCSVQPVEEASVESEIAMEVPIVFERNA